MGIYIHIPFCKQACTYCNFHFSTNQTLKDGFLKALTKEIELVASKNEWNQTNQTIYFGGGTPSILTSDELLNIINAAKANFSMAEDVEITLEANPDDINPIKLQSWLKIGINRLSVGLQSFNEEELKWMNRAHSSAQAMACINDIKAAGYSNYSVDLIYGSPYLNSESWKQHLDTIVNHRVPHISCYALTVEPKTALAHQINKSQSPPIDDVKQAEQFEILCNRLEAAGYIHYETSNFALPNFKSLHNSSYWKSKAYIGFGPSAHSYNGSNQRHWNIANNALYIQQLEHNILPIEETEVLSKTTQINESIMIGLRLKEGIDIEMLERKFGASSALLSKAITFIEENKLKLENNYLRATQKGQFLIDGIAADLFFED